MSTSAEQMTDAIGALRDAASAYNGKIAEIDARLNDVAARWDDFETSWYVDQQNGDDTYEGTDAAPLASIQEAIDRTPYGTSAYIRVRGEYSTTQRYAPGNRTVRLLGCDNNWDYAPIVMNIGYEIDAANRILTWGFSGEYGCTWDLYNIQIKAKTLTELTDLHPGATFDTNVTSVFSRVHSGRTLPGSALFRYCDIDLTDDPYCYLFNRATWTFEFLSVMQTNPLAGRYVAGIAAATPSADVGYIQTTVDTL